MLVARGMEMVVCQSFAKNMGLYCERVGAVHVVAADPGSAAAAGSQLQVMVRTMYSNPPAHGARVAAALLNTPALEAAWRAELKAAMQRLQGVRVALRAAIEANGTPGDWSHITSQIGMFSFTGLTPPQVARLVSEFGVFMLSNGRICVAGLNTGNVGVLATAIDVVVHGLPGPARG